jgi:hypothetical protein
VWCCRRRAWELKGGRCCCCCCRRCRAWERRRCGGVAAAAAVTVTAAVRGIEKRVVVPRTRCHPFQPSFRSSLSPLFPPSFLPCVPIVSARLPVVGTRGTAVCAREHVVLCSRPLFCASCSLWVPILKSVYPCSPVATVNICMAALGSLYK